MGGLNDPGVQIRWLRKNPCHFWKFWQNRQTKPFWTSETLESDSRPGFCTERTENQLIRSILEPFGEDFVPNQTKSDPFNLGTGPRQMESGPRQMEPGRNLGMDFGFFFNWGNLDFEGSKKAPETSFLDS